MGLGLTEGALSTNASNSAPVLLIAHARPRLTERVLAEIRSFSAGPLFVSVDGPRLDVPGERSRVEEVRQLASLQSPETTCLKFHERNLGSREGPLAAIDWFFSKVDEGIILEDDCLPSQDFFTFTNFCLEAYRSDPRVWGVGGFNPVPGVYRSASSHHFITSPVTWGWATWQDRWAHYDRDLSTFNAGRLQRDVWPSSLHFAGIERHLWSIKTYGQPQAWDYQLAWTMFVHDALWALPASNLIRNIGFGPDATHTKRVFFSQPDIGSIESPLTSVPREPAREFERKLLRTVHRTWGPLWISLIANFVKKLGIFLRNRARAARELG